MYFIKKANFLTLAVIASVFISGCGKKKPQALKPALQAEDLKKFDEHYAQESAQEQAVLPFQTHNLNQEYFQAKLYDIPFPLSLDLVFASQPTAEQQAQQIVLGYKTTLNLNQIAQFYAIEMELLGWKLTKAFKDSEYLFIFKKPQKTCAISMRVQTNKKNAVIGTMFTLFYG
jgi:hypothetical protein